MKRTNIRAGIVIFCPFLPWPSLVAVHENNRGTTLIRGQINPPLSPFVANKLATLNVFDTGTENCYELI